MAFAWSRVIAVACQGLAVSRWYWPSLARSQLHGVLAFGLPLAGANLVNYTLLNADYSFVGHQLGPTLLGIYVLAFNLASWSMSMLTATINGVAMPAFSRVVRTRPISRQPCTARPGRRARSPCR
jgi:lipopolysaccharide exporter